METQAISLNVHPQIIDLYEVLEKNGLHKQKEDVQSLVGYIESMEYNLSVMMNEIQEMHTEVNRLHDKGIRAQCAKIVSKVEDKVQQAKTMISVAKVKMIQSAENAVKAFQEKGKSALIHVVEAMRIPAALSKIKDIFSHAAQSMRQSAGQSDCVSCQSDYCRDKGADCGYCCRWLDCCGGDYCDLPDCHDYRLLLWNLFLE